MIINYEFSECNKYLNVINNENLHLALSIIERDCFQTKYIGWMAKKSLIKCPFPPTLLAIVWHVHH